MNDDDKLTPAEVDTLMRPMLEILVRKWGREEGMRRFNEACRRAGSLLRVTEADPPKPD